MAWSSRVAVAANKGEEQPPPRMFTRSLSVSDRFHQCMHSLACQSREEGGCSPTLLHESFPRGRGDRWQPLGSRIRKAQVLQEDDEDYDDDDNENGDEKEEDGSPGVVKAGIRPGPVACCRIPKWKQLLRRLRAETRRKISSPAKTHVPASLNYDSVSYAMNFDDGARVHYKPWPDGSPPDS